MNKNRSVQCVPGFEAATQCYGQPQKASFVYHPNQEGWRYFSRVTRERTGEVILVFYRKDGRCLVHTKSFYPSGTFRLPSGGIEPGEELLEAVRRETREETGLQPQVQRFLGTIYHHFSRKGEHSLTFTSYIFLLRWNGAQPQSQDRAEAIAGFRAVPIQALSEIAEQLESLSEEWRDWGRFRARPHIFVEQALKGKRA